MQQFSTEILAQEANLSAKTEHEDHFSWKSQKVLDTPCQVTAGRRKLTKTYLGHGLPQLYQRAQEI